MNKEKELKKKLAQLKDDRFLLQMKDHWSREDFDYANKLFDEIKLIEEELNKLETNL